MRGCVTKHNLCGALQPEYLRGTWGKRYSQSTHAVFSDEPAFVNSLNVSHPLQARLPAPAPCCACSALSCVLTTPSTRAPPAPLKGTRDDVGRFLLLPVSTYPLLKNLPVDGAEHVGWGLKITKVYSKASAVMYDLKEKGESATCFTFSEVKDMVVLSV